MARKIYRIDEFMGLDQSMGENGMAASYSPDACNMDTADGELTVAKGYTRYITSAVPGTEAIRRMFLFHSGSGDQVIVVTGGSVDYILDTTYADDEGSMRRFQQYLIKEGIIDALRAAGANENSVVRMGDWEFDFVE